MAARQHFAATVKVGDKGQIVIPKEVREIFGIQPGDALLILADSKRGIAIPPKDKFRAMTDTLFTEGEE